MLWIFMHQGTFVVGRIAQSSFICISSSQEMLISVAWLRGPSAFYFLVHMVMKSFGM